MNFSNMCLNDVGAVVQYVRDNQKQFFVEKRNCHFLGITLKGQSINTFHEKKQLLKENYVYFYNQKDDYTCKIVEAPITTYSVHFTTTQEIDTDSFVCCLSNANKIINLFQKAERAFNSNNVLELYALTYAICSEINREREKKYFPKDKRMIEAKEFIDTNFNNPNCLEEVVSRSGICFRRFCEVFRKVYNITPNKYIVQRKIDYAKGLLSTGDFSVSEVSDICNFSDVYYFSKVFKKIVGIPPNSFKKSNIKKASLS